jgi:hypothetical protein
MNFNSITSWFKDLVKYTTFFPNLKQGKLYFLSVSYDYSNYIIHDTLKIKNHYIYTYICALYYYLTYEVKDYKQTLTKLQIGELFVNKSHWLQLDRIGIAKQLGKLGSEFLAPLAGEESCQVGGWIHEIDYLSHRVRASVMEPRIGNQYHICRKFS